MSALNGQINFYVKQEYIPMSQTYLKVKIKSLSAEAQIIRKEENKAKRNFRWLKNVQGSEDDYQVTQNLYNGLRDHRLAFRPDLRASYLAYGFLRGRTYRQVENATFIGCPIWRNGAVVSFSWNLDLVEALGRASRLATKYGIEPVDPEDLKAWVLEGEAVVTPTSSNAEFAIA